MGCGGRKKDAAIAKKSVPERIVSRTVGPGKTERTATGVDRQAVRKAPEPAPAKVS
jgi:hypothetical protein